MGLGQILAGSQGQWGVVHDQSSYTNGVGHPEVNALAADVESNLFYVAAGDGKAYCYDLESQQCRQTPFWSLSMFFCGLLRGDRS